MSPSLPVPPSPDPRIAKLLEDAERKWGRGALVRWGDAIDGAEVEVVPTGFAALDEALGVGGLPCSRISEIFGPASSGKRALAAHMAAQCQKAEGVVAYIDPGRRLDPEQMKVQGVDPRSLLVARPSTWILALEMAVRLARSGGVRLLLLDLGGGGRDAETGGRGEGPRSPNLQPLTPRAQHSALSTQHSALVSLALRRLVAAVDKNGVAFVFLCDASGVQQQESTGGQAMRFFASVRLSVERKEWIRRGREVIGCRSLVQVAKNKLAAPLKEAELTLLFYRFPSTFTPLQICQSDVEATSETRQATAARF